MTRSSTLPLSVAFLILSVAHLVHGHSSGARNESCDSLNVTHVHLGGPVTGSPCGQDPCESHKLRVIGSDADTFIYNCSERYQLQLTLDRTVNDNLGESLNGYMVAPREDTGTLGADVPYVGSWVLLGADQKHVCGNQAVTQSRVLVDTVAVNMTWVPPTPPTELRNVSFWFVVVPSTAFYYLPVRSLTAIVDPDTCCTRTCMNNGRRIDSSCTCVCPPFYTGDMCQICSRMCQNNGTLNTGDCNCSCADGYSGANCENCTRMCQNEGTLNEGTCTCYCADGYSGANCENCIRMCQNNGTLNLGTCTCSCADGYSGANCETCSRVCQNGGTLITGTCNCSCADGYSGANCERMLPGNTALVVGSAVGGTGFALLLLLAILLVAIVAFVLWRRSRGKKVNGTVIRLKDKATVQENPYSETTQPATIVGVEDEKMVRNPAYSEVTQSASIAIGDEEKQ